MAKPLTIGVDVRDLRVAKTGTRTYLKELCAEFEKLNNGELRFHFLDTTLPVYTGKNKLFKLLEHASYIWWKQIVLPIKTWLKGCDVLFCTDNVVPLLHVGYKTIPVFHDAFFFEMPQNYGKLWLWLYKKAALPAARRSAFVVTPTNYAKKQIHRYTNISNEKLIVVYEGPKSLVKDCRADSDDHILSKFSLMPGKYMLHAGSMFKRKNLPALVYAFAKLKAIEPNDLKLVLAGPKPVTQFDNDYLSIKNAIDVTGLNAAVVLTGYLNDDELSSLFKNALMYVFPSTNEGFGIPVLEAFSHDLPVLVANNTALTEVGGDAVVAFDPFNFDDIAQTMQNVITSAEKRRDMIAKGRERLKEFSWRAAALQLVEIFKRAAV